MVAGTSGFSVGRDLTQTDSRSREGSRVAAAQSSRLRMRRRSLMERIPGGDITAQGRGDGAEQRCMKISRSYEEFAFLWFDRIAAQYQCGSKRSVTIANPLNR